LSDEPIGPDKANAPIDAATAGGIGAWAELRHQAAGSAPQPELERGRGEL